jgi:hypothetical protein
MATMRTYDDACAAAHVLDLVGERWALLVVRELLLGPKRFTDLVTGNFKNRGTLDSCSSCCGAAKIIPTCVAAAAIGY